MLWSKEHAITLLPAIALMILLAFILRKLLIKKDLKTRMIPFKIIAILLLILEVGKQVCSFVKGYNLYHIPLHFCSLFLFCVPLMAFYTGKHKESIKNITSTFCFCLMLFMFIYPALIYPSYEITSYFENYFSFHTVTFHNLVLFGSILIFALNLNENYKEKNIKHVILFVLIYVIIAASMSQILNVNYANFYMCNIPPIENIRIAMQQSIGYVPAQIIYVTALGILHILFVVGVNYLYIFVESLIKRIPTK